MVRRVLCCFLLLPLVACANPESPPAPTPSATSAAASSETTRSVPASRSAVPKTPSPTPPSPSPSPKEAEPFDAAAAMTTIEALAGLGPREATGEAFRQAADLVAEQLSASGHGVWTQPFDVPAGNSWGIDVPAGTSVNVIADPPGFDQGQPHVVIGAHLDSVPQSPGAEDNASGVAVMLEMARMTAQRPAALPVRFIAFGAEEPRGEGDALHHFGSTHHAASAGNVVAMVSLDRVGVPGDAVPVAFGGQGTPEIRDALVETAPVPVDVQENRSSDHWSYEKAGIPAARLGSISFSGYHSPADVPSVIDPAQLEATADVVWAWLQALEA